MGCLLRLRGLPFSCTEEDVLGFFEGSGQAVAVHLSTKNGKRSGEGYAEFATPEDAQKALAEKQHAHLATRYIELFVAGEADLLAATSGGEGARPTLRGHVVRLRGLPFNSTAQDVLAFFEGVETVGGEAGVVFTCTPDGRPTGEAYVVLAGPEAQEAALARHKDKIGARYIEIFESSRGDMYQAVQQHGYFTTAGGRRRHHWHQAQHAGGGGYPPDAGGGGGGGRGAAAMGVDDMTTAFAGFGLSQRDMQVPGPPRWGAYGAPADQRYQQYGGMQAAAGVMPQGQMRWRASGQMQAGPGGMRSGGMQHFNPAPGPPPGKGGRSSMANGTRGGGGMVAMPHDAYGGSGHGAAMVFHPFMVPPLMMQHQQQHASPWGTPGMMQQQSGAWYGGMGMGRAAMHGGQMAGMGGHTAYTAYPSHGYYPMRTPGMPQQGGYQQHSSSSRQPPPPAAAPPAANHVSAAAPPPPAAELAEERASSPQDAAEAEPAGGSHTGGVSTGSRPSSAGSQAEAEAGAVAASPATPEQ